MKKDSNEQTARIRQMERRLNAALTAVKRLEGALDKWEAAQEAIAALDEYYGSDLWRQDFADDEAGRLPEDLKRGVLSEDGIWNLLTDVSELNKRLQKVAKKKQHYNLDSPARQYKPGCVCLKFSQYPSSHIILRTYLNCWLLSLT
ncbi:MAG: DUF4298 domain-containing protein [Lachnospiraceae bacterium]|nr:DUF4298 domain-containing protein [Lachnospiraceae bacterium]